MTNHHPTEQEESFLNLNTNHNCIESLSHGAQKSIKKNRNPDETSETGIPKNQRIPLYYYSKYYVKQSVNSNKIADIKKLEKYVVRYEDFYSNIFKWPTTEPDDWLKDVEE